MSDASSPGPSSGSPWPGGRPPVDPSAAMPPPPPPPTAPPPGFYPYPPPFAPPTRRSGVLSRVLGGFIASAFILSVVMNIYLLIIISASLQGLPEATYAQGDEAHRVVVLPVTGVIDDSTAAFVHQALQQLRKDKPAAIVLRVDSTGGTVSASERIFAELKRYRAQTGVPLVTSIGGVAASGGYYVSCATEHIVAESTGITGSIGVIAPAFTIHELLNKIGVTPETVVASGSPDKDVLDFTRPWTDADRAAMRKLLDTAYDRFVQVVDEGRTNLDLQQVRALATGMIYTVPEAHRSGLVDQIGFLEDAVDKAAALAKLPSGTQPTIKIIGPRKGLIEGLTGASSPAPPLSFGVPINSDSVRRWTAELATPRLEYRWAP